MFEFNRLLKYLLLIAVVLPVFAQQKSAGQNVEHGFVDSSGVKIHYATAGDGPLLVMIHGFPDYWYTWRDQIPELSRQFKVVAIDQRGYNKSDQPSGVENYSMSILADDVQNVIKHFGHTKAVIVGHDWGGYVAWTCAMRYPESVDRLVILNAPHPAGFQRELATSEKQQQKSQYARDFQESDSASKLNAEGLAGWVKDANAKTKYIEAFKRSSFESMMNYYKANYPASSLPDTDRPAATAAYPKIKCPVLMIHGLQDIAFTPETLNNTWQWIDNDLTIVTVPAAGHFVQQDASDLVTQRISRWLK